LNQQKSQEKDAMAMSGTYGYEVPVVVQNVIGGSGLGGATVTAPAQAATAGPFATGSPVTYTVTGTGGAVVTETSSPTPGSGGSGGGGSGGSGSSNHGSGGTNVGAIVAGIVAGLFAILAAYLGFCAWVYRRQLRLYKNHVAMAQRAHLGPPGIIGAGIPAPGAFAQKSSFDARSGNSGEASGNASGSGSGRGSGRPPHRHLASNNPYASQANGNTSTANSSTDDLMSGQEPSFLGVVLNPRRSLRVVNRD